MENEKTYINGFAESRVYLQCHMKLAPVVGRSSSAGIYQRLWNSSRLLPGASFRMCRHSESSLIWRHKVMLVQEEGYPKVLGWYLRQLPRCHPGQGRGNSSGPTDDPSHARLPGLSRARHRRTSAVRKKGRHRGATLPFQTKPNWASSHLWMIELNRLFYHGYFRVPEEFICLSHEHEQEPPDPWSTSENGMMYINLPKDRKVMYNIYIWSCMCSMIMYVCIYIYMYIFNVYVYMYNINM